MRSSDLKTRIAARTQELNHQEYIRRMSSWLSQAGAMMGPASIIEKSLEEIFDLRHRAGLGFPDRAGVLSSGPLGLLASLILRLEGIEVVFMDLGVLPAGQPCQSARYSKRSSKSNRYCLTRQRLAMEIGAGYTHVNGFTVRKTAERLGPFDLILVDSGDSSDVMQALFGLGKGGALVDLSKGNRRLQVYETKPTPNFVLRHESKIARGESNARSSMDLAIADLEYPGWLEEFYAHSSGKFPSMDFEVPAGMKGGPLLNRPQAAAPAGREG